jgi:hypothetical protein
MEEAWREPNHRSIVRRLAEAELLERFIHQRYVGTKRYSLEGCAAVIPLLDAVLDISSQCGARRCLIGMSHRGRLNVMVNVAACWVVETCVTTWGPRANMSRRRDRGSDFISCRTRAISKPLAR